MMSAKNSIWSENYRPQVIEDCVLPDNIKTIFASYLKNNDIPNMLLTGKPGMGKTTIAKALCNQMNCDVMVINGSDESGIDVLRNKIKTFASTISLSGGYKVVIIDEADYLNNNSTQPAMRNFMEEYSKNCRFILTANFKHKIIEPLISRLTVIEFQIPSSEKPVIAKKIINRICYILDSEKVDYDKKVISQIAVKYFPDFRKTISEIQKYSNQHGKIDVGLLSQIEEISVKDLMTFLKEKNFTAMRKWVSEHLDNDPTWITRSVFDNLEKYLEKGSIPQAIITLADYSYKGNFVADQELNMTAMFIEIMADCVFL